MPGNARPFVVMALPRSRTFWLSKFLTYGGWNCGHDEARYLRSMDDLASWWNLPCNGSVETSGAFWWRLIPSETKIVVIKRPVNEVVDSLCKIAPFDRIVLKKEIIKADRKLNQVIVRRPDTLVVDYAELEYEPACAVIFEHCLPFNHDSNWWNYLSKMNLQIDFPALLRYCHFYKFQMNKMIALAKHSTLQNMERKKPVTSIEGVEFCLETFDSIWRDGQELFAEHCVAVGEHPEQFKTKNLELIKEMANSGGYQILSARSNGRVFGYLFTMIGPSQEDKNLLSSYHTLFYASPLFRGLGIKLQREAKKHLIERGVGEIIMREGIRGAGKRLGIMYKRLGAEPFGTLYRMDLRSEI